MISIPAIIIAIVYFLCMIAGLVIIINNHMMNVWYGISLIFQLALILLFVYDTDCLTRGGCGVWSWIRTILNVIFPIVFLIIIISTLVKRKSDAPTTPSK